MKIGYVQLSPVFHDRIATMEKIARMVADVDADLLVLPELCTTGYLYAHRDELASYAEPIFGGRTSSWFSELAKERNCAFVAGVAESDGSRFFNTTVLISRCGDILGFYRKIHLFWNEKDLFDAGETDPQVFEVGSVKLGLMVCFDWIFPEVVRVLALKGADVICHSANLVLPFAHQAMVTRAIENRVFVVLSNRVGTEYLGGQTLHFNGSSRVIDPTGTVIASSSASSEGVAVVDIRPELAREKMITPRNHVLEDRRPERYSLLVNGRNRE